MDTVMVLICFIFTGIYNFSKNLDVECLCTLVCQMILRHWVRIICQVILLLSWTTTVGVATTLNVGTTLFHPNDIGRPCWSDEEVALLASRHMFQDIMPGDGMDGSDERYISAMIQFVQLAVNEIRQKTEGNVRLVLLKSFADVIGGYLRTYLLPLTKAAFYAGNVPFTESRRLFSLMDETKSLLHTDGQHWKQPMKITVKPRRAMVCGNFSDMDRDVACEQLIFYGHGNSKRIPLPFLDDDCSPRSIALPLRAHVLVAIDKPAAESLLFTFYDTSTKCLANSPEATNFQNKAQQWLKSTILPLLDDDRWYPVFGSVRRILMENGTESNTTTEVTETPKATVYHGFFSRLSPGTMIGLLIVSAICVWVKVALCFLLCRCCRKRRQKKKIEVKASSTGVGGSGSDESMINTLVQIFSGSNQTQTDTSTENPSAKKSQLSKSSRSSLGSYQPSPSYLGHLEKKESPVVIGTKENASKTSQTQRLKFKN